MNNDLAPVVLFVYNRPLHTQQTIDALQKNVWASSSELFIYSDQAKSEDVQENVDKVRSLIALITGFKKITVINREKNFGLANSIIDGVSKVVKEYGKVIVLEDDLVTSPYFLKFMNESLDFYKNENRVWHISGWNYPIDADGLDDVFLWRLMNCWGWATWENRWRYFEKNTDKLIGEFSKQQVKYLNLDGTNDAWAQVISNKQNKISTWAVYWYATIVKNRGLCLNPAKTFVQNIGLDGSGMNCGIDNSYFDLLSKKHVITYSTSFEENELALQKVKYFFESNKISFLTKIINRIKRALNAKLYQEKNP